MPPALVWISPDDQLRVALSAEPPGNAVDRPVDVYIRFRHHEVSLRMRIQERRVCIDDLVGSGWRSGIQQQGFGRLATNVGFQFLRRSLMPDFPVVGDMPTAGDPEDDPAKAEECRVRRLRFWVDSGFTPGNGPWGREPIESTVGKLRVKPYGAVGGAYPRFVDLSRFATVDRNPIVEWRNDALLRYPRPDRSWSSPQRHD